MLEQNTDMNTSGAGAPRWMGLSLAVLAGISILGVGMAWNASSHEKTAEQTLAEQNKDLQQNVAALNERLAQEEQSGAQVQSSLNTITDHLKLTQGQLATARQQNSKLNTEYSQKLDNVQSQLATKANATDLTALGGDVNGVKGDLETTKNGLAATNNNLQMARGELGTLIAKNHDEIDELRRLGERDYYEFTIAGKGNKSKAGSLMIELRGTNPKKSQFTLNLYVDDKRLEKKNRPMDEPIYFYTPGTRAPLELVVNQVAKDKVVGYVSVPKSHPAGTTSASAAGTGS